jgi:hypothetical protein
MQFVSDVVEPAGLISGPCQMGAMDAGGFLGLFSGDNGGGYLDLCGGQIALKLGAVLHQIDQPGHRTGQHQGKPQRGQVA